MFPGVDPNQVTKALENRESGFIPPLTYVKFGPMTDMGSISIIFSDDMMLPTLIDQKYWDILFRLEVKSNLDDELVYVGLFDREE